ncbi:MAG: Nif3-like dinuclear metal center hexameric protein [Anaerolineae bacterium]
MQRKDLVVYLDNTLRISEIKDYGPQGLQVETGNEQVNRIALAVDVALPVIEAAAAWKADMLLVHHGILWRSVEPIAGPLGARVRQLMAHSINLYAAHLPLDAHPEVGNNAVLAQMAGVEITDWWCEAMGTPIGIVGTVAPKTTLSQLVTRVEQQLGTTARVLAHGPETITKVAIVSGFGADRVAEARALGADTFLTGETSHAHYWAAADHGMNLIYAGHYATETVGVKALGRRLAQELEVEVKFFNFPTAM